MENINAIGCHSAAVTPADEDYELNQLVCGCHPLKTDIWHPLFFHIGYFQCNFRKISGLKKIGSMIRKPR